MSKTRSCQTIAQILLVCLIGLDYFFKEYDSTLLLSMQKKQKLHFWLLAFIIRMIWPPLTDTTIYKKYCIFDKFVHTGFFVDRKYWETFTSNNSGTFFIIVVFQRNYKKSLKFDFFDVLYLQNYNFFWSTQVADELNPVQNICCVQVV